MNNEPVAWIGETLMGRQYINGQKGILPVGTPLYISPTCPTKTLTDEEILELTNDSTIFEYREFNDDIVRFARAVLKRASEK